MEDYDNDVDYSDFDTVTYYDDETRERWFRDWQGRKVYIDDDGDDNA